MPHRCVNVAYVVLVLVVATHLAQAGPFELVSSNNPVYFRIYRNMAFSVFQIYFDFFVLISTYQNGPHCYSNFVLNQYINQKVRHFTWELLAQRGRNSLLYLGIVNENHQDK